MTCYDVIRKLVPVLVMDNWKLVILRELRLRNQRESGGFSELITSRAFVTEPCTGECVCTPFTCFSPSLLRTSLDGNLQKQLDALRKEITRLEYENNELDKVGE